MAEQRAAVPGPLADGERKPVDAAPVTQRVREAADASRTQQAERAVEVRALSVQLGRRQVLNGISLGARFGEVTTILGPNGAGKSTLLRSIAGLVRGNGEVLLAGRPLSSLDPFERAKEISFVPQQSLLRVAMPVPSVVAQGRYAHRQGFSRLSAADQRAVQEALAESDSLALSDRLFTELSVGEQKRVLIARALATGARILLFDEPSASLDVEHALRLFELLRKLAAQGRAIVAVLHHLDEALSFSDRAALIQAGSLVAHGPTREVLSPERVRAVYGVDMVPGAGMGFRLPGLS